MRKPANHASHRLDRLLKPSAISRYVTSSSASGRRTARHARTSSRLVPGALKQADLTAAAVLPFAGRQAHDSPKRRSKSSQPRLNRSISHSPHPAFRAIPLKKGSQPMPRISVSPIAAIFSCQYACMEQTNIEAKKSSPGTLRVLEK